MANKEHFRILKQGVAAWNEWRQRYDVEVGDFVGAVLSGANLQGANLSGADLSAADLSGANLRDADLSFAHLRAVNLSDANLYGAKLFVADLRDASLEDANLQFANFLSANLTNTNLIRARLNNATFEDSVLINANLRHTELIITNFTGSILSGADFSQALAHRTMFAEINLSEVKGLESIIHIGPSEIGISTVYKSEGQISESFLRGCGVPEEFITHIPALVAATQPIQFYSCFISYSSKDEEFARRLHERMRAASLRVWFAPENIKGGEKLYEQIDRAIHVHDRLLLVLSEKSMKSEWVMTELRRARRAEVKEGRRKLFPIRLVDFDMLRDWECFDADQGKDLAVEVREYFIPDFSTWKNHNDFEAAFERLLNDLKASV